MSPSRSFFSEDAKTTSRPPQVAAHEPISPHNVAGKWRVDGVTLSRVETEWLAACFYGRSRLMPRNVRERLELLDFIDDRGQLTAAGRRWLEEHFPGLRQGRPWSGKR